MQALNIEVMGLRELEMSLGRLAPRARRILSISANDTARKLRTDLNRKARQTYVVKAQKFNKGAKLIPASNATLTAVLHMRGRPLPLSNFQIRKNTKRTAGKGHQLQSTSATPISGPNGNKTFMATIHNQKRNGDAAKDHTGLFYRLTKRRLPIEQIYASSVPVMVGGDKVFGEAGPEAERLLMHNVGRQIDLLLRRI